MKILVFGNIGSGKTTLINNLKTLFPYEVIAIDDYRKLYGDGTLEKEYFAQDKFIESITKDSIQFVECLGLGNVSQYLLEHLLNLKEKFICIKVVTSSKVCKKRIGNRIWNIPFPTTLENIDSLIDRTEEKFINNEIEKLWTKYSHVTILSFENNSNQFDTDSFKTLVSLIHIHSA